MDNANSKCDQKGEDLTHKEDRIRKNELLQEDARQSFFQLENLIFNIDVKTFGLVAIDTILITISGYFLDLTKWSNWYIPLIILGSSLIFMLLCAMPRSYDRHDPLKLINNSGGKSLEFVAAQLAVDYADLEEKLNNDVYKEKIQFFVIGSLLTFVGVISMVILMLCMYS